MVVAGILALALALPTGALFGIGYGTGVRIGYEQIYPLLFPAKSDGTVDKPSVTATIAGINAIYNAIGGKEASQMGIATGLSSAMSELDTNPDFQDLLKLESSLSGSTFSSLDRTRYGLDVSTSEELVQSEIDAFNKLNNTDLLIKFRSYTITQLNNIIQSYQVTGSNPIALALAIQVLNEKIQTPTGGETTSLPEGTSGTTIIDTRNELTSDEAPAYLIWLKNLNTILIQWSTADQNITPNPYHKDIHSSHTIQFNAFASRQEQFKKDKAAAKSKLYSLSTDYRNPNTIIRQHVLRLRQELADGKYD